MHAKLCAQEKMGGGAELHNRAFCKKTKKPSTVLLLLWQAIYYDFPYL